ncbi:hypothetical protein HOY80DRAFT_1037751 [Tuber brumale]|nr:hypothetical protein HOY80DRAFT_1037751 [Tuber brumale]
MALSGDTLRPITWLRALPLTNAQQPAPPPPFVDPAPSTPSANRAPNAGIIPHTNQSEHGYAARLTGGDDAGQFAYGGVEVW